MEYLHWFERRPDILRDEIQSFKEAGLNFSLDDKKMSEDKLTKSKSILSISEQTVNLVSWSLGAVLVSILGNEVLIYSSFGLYILSIITAGLIPEKTNSITNNDERSSLRTSFNSGWNKIISSPSTVMDIFIGIANGVWIAAILYLYVEQNLHVGEDWRGYINTALFLGMIIGGYMAFKISDIIDKNLYLARVWRHNFPVSSIARLCRFLNVGFWYYKQFTASSRTCFLNLGSFVFSQSRAFK